MSYRLGGRNPLAYQGVEPLQPPDLVVIPRDPISGAVANSDYRNFNIGTFWLNSVNFTLWCLVNKNSNIPLWISLGVAAGGMLNQLTADDTNVAFPLNFNINIAGGTNINTTATVPNTITVNLDPSIVVTSVTTTSLTVLGNATIAGTLTMPALGRGVVQSTIGGLLFSDEGIDGEVLISNTVGAPAWARITAGAGITITNGANSITVAVTGAIPGAINNIQGNSAPSVTGATVFVKTANTNVKFLPSLGTTITADFALTNNLVLGSDPSGTILASADNTGLGAGALASLTNGNANVAIGTDALGLADDGSNNIAIGVGALLQLSSASGNIAIGRNAMDGAVSVAATDNIIIGNGSGGAITAGQNNVSIGTNSVTSLTGGDNNIVIGNGSGTSFTTTSNNICIGNVGNVADSGVIRIGTNATHVATIVQGIYPVTVVSPRLVTVDVNGQLGSTPVSAASGAIVLIQTQSGAGVGSIVFNTNITNIYNNYILQMSNVTLESAVAQWLNVQLSTNLGVTYITTGYRTPDAANTSGFSIGEAFNAPALTLCSGSYTLYNLTSGVGFSSLDGVTLNYPAAAASTLPRSAGSIYNTAVVVNALRIVMTDGSTFTGTFSLYGVAF